MTPRMRARWWRAFVLFAMLCALGAPSCGGGDDDDSGDDNAPPDDDTGDDDADDDTGDGTPVLDTLHLYPEEVFPGEPINMNFHFVDPDGDLQGGTIHLAVGPYDVEPQTITYAPGTEGYITTSVTTQAEWTPGSLEVSVYVIDLAGHQSNTVTDQFVLRAANTPPTISNLRFEPDPACNEADSSFDIVFDFVDPDGNLGGGSLAVWLDSPFPTQFIISPEFDETEGTIPVTATLLEDVPDGTTADVGVQIADNQGATSERLDGEIAFYASACSR